MNETANTLPEQELPVPSEQDILQENPSGWAAPFKKHMWTLGLALLLVQSAFFAVSLSSQNGGLFFSGEFSGGFVINFLLTIFYGATLHAQKQLRWIFFARPEHYDTYFLYLSMWFVSCFTLNLEIPIFSESCAWLSWHICLTVATFVAYAWKDIFSRNARLVWYGAMAWSLVLMLYFTIYLLPVTLFASIVVWFFLIPFHAHIPLIISITLTRTLVNAWENRIQRFAIIAGLTLPMAFTIGYLNSWRLRDQEIRSAFGVSSESSAGLPRWVVASQRLSRSVMGEKWLKSEVLFEEGQFRGMDAWGGDRSNGKLHDPLIWIATALLPMPEISWDERTKILSAFFDQRHDKAERLWSDHDLKTENVQTALEINPAERLAYIEKTLTILNNSKFQGSQQEAFYTFYLPEGAVVSSLSLWINGVEEKARLSSKLKADEAYKTIVGRERRDPSLVHWQEGSQVTVRVFPCTPEEVRKFKIGVTMPLADEGEMLGVGNIVFRGPSAEDAKEDFNVQLLGSNVTLEDKPGFLKKDAGSSFTGKTDYDPAIHFHVKKPEAVSSAFSFNGKNYITHTYSPENESFKPSTIYLDINAGWTKPEIEKALKMSPGVPVKIWSNGAFNAIQKAGEGRLLQRDQFSMFPFHLIPDSETALVITKSKASTPLLEDLRESDFAKKAAQTFGNSNQPVRVWHVGDDLTPYLRSLREFRILLLFTGDWETLEKLVTAGQFYRNPEDDRTVVIPNSSVRIEQVDSLAGNYSKGSDHLLRLFAYNQIMRKTGYHYFDKKFEPAPLVREAEEAFIVTPVSSLVVLESEADYKRMGIDKNTNTLGNAAMSGKGSVPEPGEWALFLLLIFSVLYVWRRGWGR